MREMIALEIEIVNALPGADAAAAPPSDEDMYIFYGIIGDGEDHYVEVETAAVVLGIPHLWPSESYMLLPAGQS